MKSCMKAISVGNFALKKVSECSRLGACGLPVDVMLFQLASSSIERRQKVGVRCNALVSYVVTDQEFYYSA